MYSKNCIGEGINGWWNHHWTIGSPGLCIIIINACRIDGIFLATFLVTILAWLIWFGANLGDKSTKEIEKSDKYREVKKRKEKLRLMKSNNKYCNI